MDRRIENIRANMRTYRQRIREEQRHQVRERERQRSQMRRSTMDEQQRNTYLDQERRRFQNRMESMSELERGNRIRQQMQRLRQIQLRAGLNITSDTVVEPLDIGQMNILCIYCGALRFRNENRNCCHNGKVHLPALLPYPEQLKRLFEGTDRESVSFFKNIRNYNCAFSFASFGVNLSIPSGRGPYCFRIQGQTYHKTTTLHPDHGHPKYGQLYIVDSNEALQYRLNALQNSKCCTHTMSTINEVMQEINPYVHLYKNMDLIEKEQQNIAIRQNQPMLKCELHFRRGNDIKRYNFPTSNEIAVIFVGENGAPPENRDIVIYPRNMPSEKISYTSCHLDPMSYPILFPHGEFGWHCEMQHAEEYRTRVRNHLTMQQFYIFRLSFRGGFSIIHRAGKLFQQYLVDAYVKVEGCRLQYLRNNQSQLRVEHYNGLMDYLNRRIDQNIQPGVPVILPSSFTGSPRNMHQNFNDAMSIVAKYGKPDIFITYTCNPKCPEIINNLYANETPENRPDLIARVYNLQLKELLSDIKEKNIFGVPVAYVYVVEFQKRGLPHCHMLVVLRNEDKLRNKNDIDKLVSAEIPDINDDPALHDLVKKFMIHGPCGTKNPSSPCMNDGGCLKHYPKEFRNETSVTMNGYPQYRRRKNGRTVQVGNHIVDNSYVVPYNAYLLKKFRAHINVEICSSVQSIKYIFKYIYKGHDCASIEVKNTIESHDEQNVYIHDEINNYIACRYVSPPEAMWRLSEFRLHDMSHTVYRLAVHLENQHKVYFHSGNAQQAVHTDTTLTAWFKLNEHDANAQNYLYPDIPLHYVFNKHTKTWTPRKRNINIISRMYTVNPKDVEKFHLRMLLLHVPGAKNFEDLRIVEGELMPTFKEACLKLGLLQNDESFENALIEATVLQMPSQLRVMFAAICAYSNPTNSLDLWNNHKNSMMEDFLHQGFAMDQAENMALQSINTVLIENGTNCLTMGLPEPVGIQQMEHEAVSNYSGINTLTDEQRLVSDIVIESVTMKRKGKVPKYSCFYVDAPGGCGKTYMFNVIISHLRNNNYQVCCGAWTGIASTLLLGGRTIHSLFKLPIALTETSICNVSPTSDHANYLKNIDLIVLDEASMIPSFALDAIDKTLRDISNNNNVFGGKIMFLGGDFRQVLPILSRGSREEIIEICIKNSPLWLRFKQYSLSQNIRATPNESEFASWLLNVGNGTANLVEYPGHSDNEDIEVPQISCIDGSLVDDIFKNISQLDRRNRIILSPKNSDCLLINEEVLHQLPGNSRIYYSTDKVQTDDPVEAMRYQPEFLNSLTPSGMPPHKLFLKPGCIVMLLRNISIKNGLCNGTRLEVKNMHEHSIEAALISGALLGKHVLLPRIKLAPSDPKLPFILERNQFPIRLSYAMTINKSQGQTFEKVGLFLPQPVFSHGQLYVALSRARRLSDIRVKVMKTNSQGKKKGKTYTKNIVCREVFF